MAEGIQVLHSLELLQGLSSSCPLSTGQISVRIVWRINLSLYLLHFPEFLNQILERSTGEYPHSVKLCPCYSIRNFCTA